LISYKNEMSLVKVYLKTGRSHQIRVQFSSHNHPLYGDQKYNKNTPKDNIALFASSLSFYHPITNELLEFKQELPNKYPFNIF
ncbi:MAG: RNA pseudouridine synthase, partial [Bacilli bacterium]